MNKHRGIKFMHPANYFTDSQKDIKTQQNFSVNPMRIPIHQILLKSKKYNPDFNQINSAYYFLIF